MVIVVLGILAAVAIPRMERDLRQEAGDNILAAIRYTQHLALMDNKVNPDDTAWQKTLWQIQFADDGAGKHHQYYRIGTDLDKGGQIDYNEAAIDPATGKRYHNRPPRDEIGPDESPSIFIGNKYGINRIDFSGGCVDIKHIAFDHLGRPHVHLGGEDVGNDFQTLMKGDCLMTFGFEGGEEDLSISVAEETGYAQIVGQDGS